MAAMQARVAELDRRLDLNSSNGDKPPSSDGLKKPARVSTLRKHSGNKPGGQKDHPERRCVEPGTRDAIINRYPSACAWCSAPLTERRPPIISQQTGGLGRPPARGGEAVPDPVLALFVSSVKQGPGAAP
jgi:Family of unknown function (DUF6444)